MPHPVPSPSPPVPAPDILVADDDPSTRQFLAGALASMGYRVALAHDGTQAVAMGRERGYEAMLLDCRMPGAGAAEVLAALRNDTAAASRNALALATSAEIPPVLRAALLADGFAAVIEKPCKLASLESALVAIVGPGAPVPLVDDAAALDATGDAATMHALRRLLHDELKELHGALDGLAARPADLTERLHRLRSACGFCGTRRLGTQARALQNHMAEADGITPAALKRFRTELSATIAILGP